VTSPSENLQPVQTAPVVSSVNHAGGASSGLPSLQRLVSSGSQTPQTFVPSMEDIVEEELSRTALTEFYQRGITGDSPGFRTKKAMMCGLRTLALLLQTLLT
jgi:hypothetical protein